MRVLRPILQVLGILAVLMGLLWIGQGTGMVMWPRESFMLAEPKWAWNGALLAGSGAVLLWRTSRRAGFPAFFARSHNISGQAQVR